MKEKISRYFEEVKYKDLAIFILSAYLVLLVTCIFINHFTSLRKFTEVSGTIGDTLGGILGPMVGVISIYYVYKAFEEQRKTNTLQELANDLLKRQLNKEFILNLINGLRKDLEDTVYVSGKEHFSGIGAVEEVTLYVSSQENHIWIGHRNNLIVFYFKISSFLKDVTDLWQIINNKGLNSEDLFEMKQVVISLLNYYLVNYYPILDNIRLALTSVPSQPDQYSNSAGTIINVNALINIVTSTNKYLAKLNEYGLLVITDDVQTNQYQEQRIMLKELDLIKRSQFKVQTLQ